jgi:Rod binding domain-containing protein
VSTIRDITSPATASQGSSAGRQSPLMDACRQVEGLFLSHLMEAMDRPTFRDGIPGSSSATRLFRSQRNRAIADEMGARGDLGLAQMLHDDLSDPARMDGAAPVAPEAHQAQGLIPDED